MEKIKEEIEQVKVQLLTGIKLGRVEKEWGNMIIETCNRALTIPVVVSTLDLGKLQNKIDEILDSATKEELQEWMG